MKQLQHAGLYPGSGPHACFEGAVVVVNANLVVILQTARRHVAGMHPQRRLAARAPERLLQVDWGKSAGRRYPVDLVVRAMDRRGLLRDITTVVAEERIDIERLASQGDPAQGSADLSLRVAVGGMEDLTRLLARLAAMPGIISARRK